MTGSIISSGCRNCHVSPLCPLCLFSCPPLSLSLSLSHPLSPKSVRSLTLSPDAPPSLICPLPQRVAQQHRPPSLSQVSPRVGAESGIELREFRNSTHATYPRTRRAARARGCEAGKNSRFPVPSLPLSLTLMGVSGVHAPAPPARPCLAAIDGQIE